MLFLEQLLSYRRRETKNPRQRDLFRKVLKGILSRKLPKHISPNFSEIKGLGALQLGIIRVRCIYAFAELALSGRIVSIMPAPIVLPPSRITNFIPVFIAIASIKKTSNFAVSPGVITSCPG